ncbi:hypothetical protein NX059_003904 [Plenodomus lindquistii]|nr:hypothetical protein NX059_003904 [Plenodomus lindquistii]
MAPTKETPKARPPSQKTTSSGITKPKRKGPVRRFENGMLDVSRKSGRNLNICRQNAQSRLLRLPGELRNQIWELALGGHIFGTNTRASFFSALLVTRLAPNPFALLQVCRQIYAETALLPFQLSEFRFPWAWVSRLPRHGRSHISHISCVSYPDRWLNVNQYFGLSSQFHKSITTLSQGLRSMTMKVSGSAALFAPGGSLDSDGLLMRAKRAEFEKIMKGINEDIEVSFEFGY